MNGITYFPPTNTHFLFFPRFFHFNAKVCHGPPIPSHCHVARYSLFYFATEAIKPSVEISGRVYTSSGSLVDMHVGDNLTAIVTTPVNINCTAKGIPKPRMRWKMNGQQLGNGGNYKTDNNGALGITRLEDPGEFTCIAENFMGHDDASSFITILGLWYFLLG